MQKEIDSINQEHQRQKELRAEQERLAEQKVIEYMKQKAVRKLVLIFVESNFYYNAIMTTCHYSVSC